MAEIYLDPMIIILATVIIVGMIAFFDFLPYEKKPRTESPEPAS